MRRQTGNGGTNPAGSSRGLRLDPFSLPHRFAVSDAGADGSVRFVELTRERVVLRRSVRGMLMAVNLPVAAYLGVALRIEASADAAADAVALVLAHRDGGLSFPLYSASDSSEVIAEWQSWGRVLRLPLLVAEADGALREPFRRIGAVRVGAMLPRRRKHSALRARRPSILLRRKGSGALAATPIHRGEREIIARN
ncbi:MAG TPA: DUF6101 family protein [Xanthobacteraceae bacterium]|nr:DUF6101 family protein [Xanthobacteraceae bacterium]